MSDWKGTKAPTSTTRSSYAASISRVLRASGVPTRPGSSPRNKQGLRVAQNDDTSARIIADYDTDGDARTMADAAEDALHAAGHRTTRTHDNRLFVHRDGDAADSRDTRHLAWTRGTDSDTYPSTHGIQVSTPHLPGAVVARISTRTPDTGLSKDEALKLAEQLYHAATGKELPR